MKKQLLFSILAALAVCRVEAQTPRTTPTPATRRQPSQAPPQTPAATQTQAPAAARTQAGNGFDLAEYGVRFEADPRLIVMMAALDAAGLDVTPQGSQATAFRASVRRDLSGISPDLRARLQNFYQRNKLPEPATPAQQAARYVSLALALGPPPLFESPARSEDLPTGLLEVLDFAPLVREFYRASGIAARLPEYVRASLAEGDRLRRPTGEMMRAVLSYLHTRPVTTIVERVPANDPAQTGKKKTTPERRINLTREKERRFIIVPELLAAPGSINFRIIGDDYYAIVPYGIDPTSSELRRAYLQYVVDPLILRINRDVAARRNDLKTLLDARRTASSGDVSPDVFLAVARSLTTAADARIVAQSRLAAISQEARTRLAGARNEVERAAITKEIQEKRQAVEDAATVQLADAYERGAVLAFFFAEQLASGLESAGFDIANFLPDMIASFKVERETRRPSEYAAARQRFNAARARAQQQARASEQSDDDSNESPESSRRAALAKSLSEVSELLRLKNYPEAEARLRDLLTQYQGEPRIFFALGQAASLAASDAFDERLQADRLNRALSHYRLALDAASPDTDRALISRAHAAMGRILAFLERKDEALKEFDAAIQLGEVEGGAYNDALAEKKKLQP